MSIARDLYQILILSIALVLFVTAVPISAEDQGQPAVFVDLDGDGFQDSAVDTNNDDIPDMDDTESDMASQNPGMQVQTVNPFADMPQTLVVAPKTSWKVRFGLRRIAALGLGANRCDFDAAAGNNDNTGASGLGGGGACAGGICLPR